MSNNTQKTKDAVQDVMDNVTDAAHDAKNAVKDATHDTRKRGQGRHSRRQERG